MIDDALERRGRMIENARAEDRAAALVLAHARAHQGWFLTDRDVATLTASEQYRLTPVYVRCSGCRFTCAVQYVAHLIALVESGTDNGDRDWVRDISLLRPLAEIVEEVVERSTPLNFEPKPSSKHQRPS